MQAILLLVAVLAVASILLVPGQSNPAAGVEVLAVCVPLWTGLDWIERQNWKVVDTTHRRAFAALHTVQLQVPGVLFVGGGVLVVAGDAAGFYWFPAAMIVSFLVTILEAWVILIEINR